MLRTRTNFNRSFIDVANLKKRKSKQALFFLLNEIKEKFYKRLRGTVLFPSFANDLFSSVIVIQLRSYVLHQIANYF